MSIVLDYKMEECPEFKINESLKDFSIINKLKYLEMEKILQSRPNSGIFSISKYFNLLIIEKYLEMEKIPLFGRD